MSSTAFTGYDTFSVESAVQVAPAIVRVTYTRIPVASSPTGSNDALNPANYSLSGPASLVGASVAAVSSDPRSFDVTANSALALGSWTITVQNVQGVSPTLSLTGHQAGFTATQTSTQSDLNGGAVNQTAEDTLRRHIPGTVKGKITSALIAAVATGDTYKSEQIQAARKQLFLSTATGRYLSDRAFDVGVFRPKDVGMGDEPFRKLAISLTTRKLVVDALLGILEVFYGEDAVRAFAQSGNHEPFASLVGQSLLIDTDQSGTATVTFQTSDFSAATAPTALEVSDSINRQLRLLGIKAYALPWLNTVDQHTYVRIYSGARGLRGQVTVRGGQAMGTLAFPTDLAINSSGTVWTITNPTPSTMRFAAGTDPGLSTLRTGDFICLYGSEFNTANRGTYTVTNVYIAAGSRYFEIANPAGFAQTVTQTATASLKFYRPTKETVQDGQRTATVLQPSTGSLIISMPATTQVVDREIGSAAYLHKNGSLSISSLSRDSNGVVTLFTTSNHGLSAGQTIVVEGVMADPSAGNSGGGLNGLQTIATVPAANELTFSTLDHKFAVSAVLAGGTITSTTVPSDNQHEPYLLDPKAGFMLGSVASTTTQQLNQGESYRLLSVSSASSFPDQPGWLVISLGYNEQAGPIPYLGRASATQLLLDQSYRFPNTIQSGATVRLLGQKAPWVPDGTGLNVFYATHSTAGRQAAEDALDMSTAAGIQVVKQIVYPSDRGLGGEGRPATGQKVTDNVPAFSGIDADHELKKARNQ